MSDQVQHFYIGWDVGAWNCDNNSKSRDALVILDESGREVGLHKGTNLRQAILTCATPCDWLLALGGICHATLPRNSFHVTMAIDTPLGFPIAFRELLNGSAIQELQDIADCPPPPKDCSGLNQYLFRETERLLFRTGQWTPLSAIKDMIGSQSSKALHVLAKYKLTEISTGVWSDTEFLTIIETYPTTCRKASPKQVKRTSTEKKEKVQYTDLDDARTCAEIAQLFATDASKLQPPPQNLPDKEGWIWAPRQAYAMT